MDIDRSLLFAFFIPTIKQFLGLLFYYPRQRLDLFRRKSGVYQQCMSGSVSIWIYKAKGRVAKRELDRKILGLF
jgi:hypothetical protein